MTKEPCTSKTCMILYDERGDFMEKMYDYFINKVFTIPYIDKMISDSNPDTFLKCVKRYVKTNNSLTYGEAISEIYNYMNCSYRNEYFYKNTIFNQLLVKNHNLYDTAALTELPISDSKADFIMINGKGIVYEIKTDLDNFSRLESQISDYYKAFKYVNVVVGCGQYEKVKYILKDTKVGIYVLNNTEKLICKKTARSNEADLSYETMFKILRKNEFENILLKHYKKLPQVSSFYYYRECQKWIEKINIKTLHKEFLFCLKQRTLLVIEDMLEDSVPYELRFYAYFSKKNSKNYEIINKFWNSKMGV